MAKIRPNILEIRKSKRGKWFLRLRSSNGKIMMASETFDSKRNAIDSAESIAWKPIEIKKIH